MTPQIRGRPKTDTTGDYHARYQHTDGGIIRKSTVDYLRLTTPAGMGRGRTAVRMDAVQFIGNRVRESAEVLSLIAWVANNDADDEIRLTAHGFLESVGI